MKQRLLSMARILSLMLVFVMFMAGCDNGTDTGGDGTPDFYGTFVMDSAITGNGEVQLELDKTYAPRNVTSASYVLSGKLKDSSGTYQLIGCYEPDTGVFILSADGSNLRHCITGAFGSTREILAANALVFNKNKTDQNASDTFKLEKRSGSISGNETPLVNGLSNEFLGRWEASSGWHSDGDGEKTTDQIILISPFMLDLTRYDLYRPDEKAFNNQTTVERMIFADISLKSGYYDIVTATPKYKIENANQLAAAFESYLDEIYNITGAVRITDFIGGYPQWEPGEEKQYAVNGDVVMTSLMTNSGVSIVTTGQWNEYLLAYLRDTIKITPKTQYEKYKISLSNDKLIVNPYTDGSNSNFNTLAEAKAATTLSGTLEFSR